MHHVGTAAVGGPDSIDAVPEFTKYQEPTLFPGGVMYEIDFHLFSGVRTNRKNLSPSILKGFREVSKISSDCGTSNSKVSKPPAIVE